MITYRKGAYGLFLIFRLSGTAWPNGIGPGLFSAVIGLVVGLLEEMDVFITDKTLFVTNPYPYQLFAYLVGYMLVFRSNFGYGRYWDALDAVTRMGSKWLDGACMAIAFDAQADETSMGYLQSSIVTGPTNGMSPANFAQDDKASTQGVEHPLFFEEVVHLFSLMHALALEHLRCEDNLHNLQCAHIPRHHPPGEVLSNDSDDLPTKSTSAMNVISAFAVKDPTKGRWSLRLPVLKGVSDVELETLRHDPDGHLLTSLARVTMVESWIMRRVTARQKHEPAGDMCNTPAPILSRMVQVISDGHLAFSQAAKIAETPFPFPYQNIMSIFLWLFALTTPFMVNANLVNIPARFVVNFISVCTYFSLAEVCDNLEDPYMPYDPNDLPLEAIHRNFNSRLITFGAVPSMQPMPAPPGSPCGSNARQSQGSTTSSRG